MSRLGKLPINIPNGVEVTIEPDKVKVKGPKGELEEKLHPLVSVTKEGDEVLVDIDDKKDRKKKSFWGLYKSLIENMVKGVTEGFKKKLEVNGVGYRASVSGTKLILNVGYSHPVEFPLPPGISAEVEDNIITVSGFDKQLVGEVAANVRKVRKPEPYKGKGIKYIDEVIIRKEGKSASKTA